jgi:hypothetical protein
VAVGCVCYGSIYTCVDQLGVCPNMAIASVVNPGNITAWHRDFGFRSYHDSRVAEKF